MNEEKKKTQGWYTVSLVSYRHKNVSCLFKSLFRSLWWHGARKLKCALARADSQEVEYIHRLTQHTSSKSTAPVIISSHDLICSDPNVLRFVLQLVLTQQLFVASRCQPVRAGSMIEWTNQGDHGPPETKYAISNRAKKHGSEQNNV